MCGSVTTSYNNSLPNETVKLKGKPVSGEETNKTLNENKSQIKEVYKNEVNTTEHQSSPKDKTITELFAKGLEKNTDTKTTNDPGLQSFLRGDNATILKAFMDDPRSKTLVDNIMMIGDAHLENLGFYKDKDGKVAFNFNDFDQSNTKGNYKFDLMMGALSTLAIAKDKGFDQTQVNDLLSEYFKTYAGDLANYQKDPKNLKDPQFNDGIIDKVQNKCNDPEKAKTWLDSKVSTDGKELIKEKEPDKKGFHFLPGDENQQATLKNEIINSFKSGSTPSILENVAKKLGVKVEDLEISDVSTRKAGNGSAGNQRYAILVQVKGKEPIILDMKQATPPSSDPNEKNNGERVDNIANQILKDNISHFGATKKGDVNFYVSDYSFVTSRDIRPDDKSFDFNSLKSLALGEAKLLANLHAKSGKGDQILAENKDNKITNDLTSFANDFLTKLKQ
jgi:hypothetical protein